MFARLLQVLAVSIGYRLTGPAVNAQTLDIDEWRSGQARRGDVEHEHDPGRGQRRRAHHHAQPARQAQLVQRGDAPRAACGARRCRRRDHARRAADRRRQGLLRRPGSRPTACQGEGGKAPDLGHTIDTLWNPLVRAIRGLGQAGRLRRQRRRGRRRRQPGAGLRYRARRALGALHPAVLPARARTRRRRHVASAAPRRRSARQGPRHARRAAVGRAGGSLGHDLEGGRRRQAAGRSDEARARTWRHSRRSASRR